MKKIIPALFPYYLYLHMFQLERYDQARFFKWLKNNFFVRTNLNKKPLVVTSKITVISWLSLAWFVVLVAIGFLITTWLGVLVACILIVQPYLLIMLGIVSMKPYEIWNRARTIAVTRSKIAHLNHTKIVGIAGSYGKTSVKDILFHLLKSNYKVLKTPLSYNTIFGIAQVVDLELDDSYDYFLCELGEFQRNDVMEMCEMVLPSFGIMTGINDQHLERFKTIKNTIATIFELSDYLKRRHQKTVANGLNAYIHQEISNRNPDDFIMYSSDHSSISISDVKFSDQGTSFVIHSKGSIYPIQTPLLGFAHINNILGALTLALQIGAPMNMLAKKIETLPHVKHRFDQKVLPNGLLLIDNSYSSNSDSFKESIRILKGLPRKTKILVTPGMVELGNQSNAIHRDLGLLATDVCSYVVLVGTSDRTRSLAETIDKNKVVWMDDIRNLWPTIDALGISANETVVLLENDLPDNY